MDGPEKSNLGRRNFLQMTGAGIVAASAGATATQALASPPSVDSEISAGVVPQPSPEFPPDMTTSDILVETLIDWGATHVFGIVGDGINSIIESLRKRQDRIRYIAVRHEEAAAFMASGWAKHTGRLGVCVGTTGPGAIHLMNGLYDAAFDGAPVVALTGLTFHDLRGVRYQQGVDTVKLMEPLAVYNEEVTGPEHAILIANRACRAALGDRGVAHLAISKDVQLMKLSADKRSMRNPGARSSSSWSPPLSAPPARSAEGCRRRPQRGLARRDSRGAGRALRSRGGHPTRRRPRRARREGAARQGGVAGRQPLHHRWYRRSRDGALVLGDAKLRHRAHPRVDDAMGRILPEARAGAWRPGRPQARSPRLAISGRDRPDGRRQGDARRDCSRC